MTSRSYVGLESMTDLYLSLGHGKVHDKVFPSLNVLRWSLCLKVEFWSTDYSMWPCL